MNDAQIGNELHRLARKLNQQQAELDRMRKAAPRKHTDAEALRFAAEWLADNGYGLPGPLHPAHKGPSAFIKALRVEADRLEADHD